MSGKDAGGVYPERSRRGRLEGVDQERARAFVFCVIPTEVEGPRIPELRNGSQIFKKWSETVLCCWGFRKNVSRETLQG